jgi:hypothetical protein
MEKSREMGATYVSLGVILWYWRFVPGSNFLLGSRKQDYVDNTAGASSELSNKEESFIWENYNTFSPECMSFTGRKALN